MAWYILGIPNDSILSKITVYTDLQDAAALCENVVTIFAEDLVKAKQKYKQLKRRKFKKKIISNAR